MEEQIKQAFLFLKNLEDVFSITNSETKKMLCVEEKAAPKKVNIQVRIYGNPLFHKFADLVDRVGAQWNITGGLVPLSFFSCTATCVKTVNRNRKIELQ